MKRKLGEILVELGAIDDHQLQAALELQKRYQNRIKLGSSLVTLGFLSEEKLTEILSRYLNIPMVNLGMEMISPDVLQLIGVEVCEKFQIMPFRIFEENRKKVLGLAMADPTNLEPIDVVQFSTSLNIRPYVAAPSDVDRAIQKYYHGILIDGISYIGTGRGEEKVKIISKGEEITWHGGKLAEPPRTVPVTSEAPGKRVFSSEENRVVTSATPSASNEEMMSEMMKLLREQNALMKALLKKGIITEEDLEQELKRK